MMRDDTILRKHLGNEMIRLSSIRAQAEESLSTNRTYRRTV